MNVVHIPGLPNPSMLPQPQSDDGYAETSYQHGEPVTSSRPPSALDVRFAEEVCFCLYFDNSLILKQLFFLIQKCSTEFQCIYLILLFRTCISKL